MDTNMKEPVYATKPQDVIRRVTSLHNRMADMRERVNVVTKDLLGDLIPIAERLAMEASGGVKLGVAQRMTLELDELEQLACELQESIEHLVQYLEPTAPPMAPIQAPPSTPTNHL
ncbi:MAG: hypothetical protein ACN2B6_12585 [Rickettsiales bacterium]